MQANHVKKSNFLSGHSVVNTGYYYIREMLYITVLCIWPQRTTDLYFAYEKVKVITVTVKYIHDVKSEYISNRK